MTLGQAIKQRRAELQKTASECAALAHMTPSEWSRWESGQSRRKDGQPSEPRRETIEAISYALECSAVELMAAAGMTEQPDYPAELATIWNRVPRERQAGFLRAVRSVADAVSV